MGITWLLFAGLTFSAPLWAHNASDVVVRYQGESRFCSQCQAKKWKSEVYEGVTMNYLTHCLPGYWGKDGKRIPQECNGTTGYTYYSCSKEHTWQEFNTRDKGK